MDTPKPEKIDVLAILRRRSAALPSDHIAAVDAVAELIEADREVDAAEQDCSKSSGMSGIGGERWHPSVVAALERLNAAQERRKAALARIGGAA